MKPDIEIDQARSPARPWLSPRLEKWSVRLSALLVAAMAVVNLFSSVTRPFADRLVLLEQFSPLQVRHGGRLTSTLAGFALLLLATQLWRRKRVAWFFALILLAVSVVSHLLKGLDYEEAGIGLLLMAVLLALRRLFHARSDAPSGRRGLQVLAFAVLFTLVYGSAGFYLMEHAFRTRFSLPLAIEQTLVMFTQFYDPGLEPISSLGKYFADSIYIVGAVTIGYALLMLVQPVLVRAPATSAERERARRIVAAHGRTSLAGFTLLDDKSYLFAADWLVAYVPRRGVALALGDPIGPPAQAEEAIRRFCDVASRNGWLPAFYQTLPDFLPLYARSGLEAVCIGHEAIVEVDPFRLEGNANKPLRTQINRMQRLQHTAAVNTPPIAGALLAELHEISDAWLSARHSSEMGFAVGRFDDDYIRQSLVTTVRDPRGRVTAFVSAAPEYQELELAIDLMRRRMDAEPGTMEMLLVTLIHWARDQGYPRLNLGLSGLAGIGEMPSDPALERALHFIYNHLNQFYNFKGLHAFKEKFHPVWSPRYLIYPGTSALPAVLAALVRAETGGGALFRTAQRLALPVRPSHPE